MERASLASIRVPSFALRITTSTTRPPTVATRQRNVVIDATCRSVLHHPGLRHRTQHNYLIAAPWHGEQVTGFEGLVVRVPSPSEKRRKVDYHIGLITLRPDLQDLLLGPAQSLRGRVLQLT